MSLKYKAFKLYHLLHFVIQAWLRQSRFLLLCNVLPREKFSLNDNGWSGECKTM